MRKKTYLTGFLSLSILSLGVLGWSHIGQSNSLDLANSPYADSCALSENGEVNKCCVDYNEAIDALEKDWEENLENLVDQEKPASRMVDDAYENLRTYDCWLEYICRAVEYSGYAPIESALGTGLTSKHLGRAPGCQLPENLKMESNYNDFVQGMKQVPLLGSAIVAKENLYIQNKINFFPSCMSDPVNNRNPNLAIASTNFQACKVSIEKKFGCNDEETISDPIKFKECIQSSNALVKMETAIKQSSADQKSSALERKLGGIVSKLSAMEEHVGYLSNFLKQLDSRMDCIANQCS